MARMPRLVVPGYPHHVTQRGTRRMKIFSDDDYRYYLELVADHKDDAGVAIWAYCLMPNHVHLVAVPERKKVCQLIENAGYDYNDFGSLTSRTDVLNGQSESFGYDNVDRLTSAQIAGNTAVSYDFNAIGNMTTKSDLGDPLLYELPQLHALSGVTRGATVDVLNYDANGNLSHGDNQPTISWSSYNMPIQITKGGVTYNFSYAPDRSRYKKVKGAETTHYVDGSYERINVSFFIGHRHYIRANGKVVMIRSAYPGGALHQYVHRDHLGSVTALTDEATGTVAARFSYDAWGQRRDALNWSLPAPPSTEPRGYTGHEHLDDVGLIHMNGRLYSPSLGRMLSPDPVTQAPEDGQNYNRYSYANNNPLKYTDPSGFQFQPTMNEGISVYGVDIMKAASCAYGEWVSCGSLVTDFVKDYVVGKVRNFIRDSIFGLGGNSCDRTCKVRQSAMSWCKAQARCAGEIGTVREKFRKRAAVAIMQAEAAGDDWTKHRNGVVVVPVGATPQMIVDKALELLLAGVRSGELKSYGLYKDNFRVKGGLDAIVIHAVDTLPPNCGRADGACVTVYRNAASPVVESATIYVRSNVSFEETVELVAHELKHLTISNARLSQTEPESGYFSWRESDARATGNLVRNHYFKQ